MPTLKLSVMNDAQNVCLQRQLQHVQQQTTHYQVDKYQTSSYSSSSEFFSNKHSVKKQLTRQFRFDYEGIPYQCPLQKPLNRNSFSEIKNSTSKTFSNTTENFDTALLKNNSANNMSSGINLSNNGSTECLIDGNIKKKCLSLRSIDLHSVNSLHIKERVRINVSGQIFEARSNILNRHPSTLLGNRGKWEKFYDEERNEIFFDRHRPSFEAIFFYYQFGGLVRRPYQVPNEIFLEELLFYELEEDVIEEYKKSEGYSVDEIILPNNPTMRYIWNLFEYPETSKTAFAIAVLSVIMTVVSIVLFCIETLPKFSQSHCVEDEAPNFLDPFFVIETTCTLWFTIELAARFLSCPNKLEFWKDLKNIVDFTAIIPYYVTLANVLSTMSCSSAKSSASLSFLRVIRLIRIFKLTKHSVGLQILLLTFKASLEGLGLFLVALVVSLLVFSSAIYYAELGNPNSQMDSIPDAFWWAIITMTTVGYGDKVPVGVEGKLIGAACAITGVLTLAIPVPIITGHFNRFYAHKTGRGRHI
ncbi:hypothetical protein HELRODRAFT_168092 [Helobdella robusta]|uniref:BTB domain-containing protein n=1 Tax=Helobdella robusta TaxID=6412 RepID=T1F057_HELRO|nr:hypothetical protein HELRODRAFT_168092 [Helobdella robusta]ESO10211.1 hypothetical protein HELRODRAFT_168092 [Helobdella robusta]